MRFTRAADALRSRRKSSLRARLLQVRYTVRSERLLMEHLDYNFRFRGFVGLRIDEPVWDATGVHEAPRAAAGGRGGGGLFHRGG